jgi:Recombinase
MFRQRSREALRLKAARGELHTTVAIGYRRSTNDRLEQDRDGRIRETLSLVFRKFAEIGSVRQLVLWLRQERIELPVVIHGRQGLTVQWRLPKYHTVHRLLTNPVYAGAYVFGRTVTQARFEGGRKVVTHGIARRREEWEVVIRDHHDGYITWEAYDRNQTVIAGNANMKGLWCQVRCVMVVACWLDYCDAVTADAGSKYTTMSVTAPITSAIPRSATSVTRTALPLAICALTPRFRHRCCMQSHHWRSRRHSN